MIVKLYSKNTSEKHLSQICEVLEGGGVVIYPTDSLYAFGASIHSPKAIERLKELTGKNLDELAIICSSISQVAEYCRIDNAEFKILKRNLPGAITFILKASQRTPEKAIGKRKMIGVRIPDNDITMAIIERLGVPMVTASVKAHAEGDEEYTTDPELIDEVWGDKVAMVVDGGLGLSTPTTVVELNDGEVEIIREGAKELN
ncbi:MAG: L-threonylcarbamoyladenylate synthase [Rikenellaceae bacterium]